MAFRATYLAVLAVTLLGQLAALGFEMAAAARFGTGREADALAFALVVVTVLSAELAGWVSTLVVPLYVEARAADPRGATAFLRRALLALIALAAAVALVFALGAPAIAGTLAPALGATGARVLRACAPLLVLVPVATLFAAALQAHGRFAGAAARQLAWYGGGLLALLVWAPTLGALAAPLGMAVGIALFAVGLAVAARDAAGRAPGARGGPSLGRAGGLLLPLAVLSLAAAANVAVERALAARLPEGSLAALTYGYRLLHFPLALFVVNATAMLLPTLAGHAVREEASAADALTARALRLTLVFSVPLAALALALAEPVTALLLERGAFTRGSTAVTATAIAWYAPGVVAMALAQVLVRVYQARQALWTLAAMTGIGIAVNVALMPALAAWLGFVGLPLASTLSGFALVAVLLRGLGDRASLLHDAVVGRGAAAVVVAGLAALAAAWLARLAAGNAPLAATLAGGVAGVVVYGATLAALAPGDARAALALVAPRRAGRVGVAP